MEGGQRLQGEGRGNRVWVGLRPPIGIFQKNHLYLFVSEKYRIFAAVITKQREDGSNDTEDAVCNAGRRHRSKAYVTRRWHLLAIINKNLPFFLFKRL
jgi:hypothetical protein